MNNIQDIILYRRTVKPTAMNGKKIDDETIRELLQLADWAPTHGLTEPWYFMVYGGDKVQKFCTDHAELYKQFTPQAQYIPGNYEKLKTQGDLASHVIAVVMRRGANPKIPEIEELEAVACALQNLMLSATAAGLGSFWSSPPVLNTAEFQTWLGIRAEDRCVALMYLGWPKPGLNWPRSTRQPIDTKIVWNDA